MAFVSVEELTQPQCRGRSSRVDLNHMRELDLLLRISGHSVHFCGSLRPHGPQMSSRGLSVGTNVSCQLFGENCLPGSTRVSNVRLYLLFRPFVTVSSSSYAFYYTACGPKLSTPLRAAPCHDRTHTNCRRLSEATIPTPRDSSYGDR